MEYSERHKLIDQYLNGQATEQETHERIHWYRDQLPEDAVWESDNEDEERRVKARIAQRIQSATQVQVFSPSPKVRTLRWKWGAAIVAAGLCGAWLLFSVSKKVDRSVFASQPIALIAIDVQEDAEENRFILLPDSSRVILRPGSKLEYRTDFKGKTREVALVGEGYFDIQRDESRPFMVYAGDVRTVVLGTAFTIRADEGQDEVQVTVQHGKVRVERQEKILAELAANQQLDVDRKTTTVEQKVVVAEKALSWMSEDMRFDAHSFGDLVDRLQRRYDVEITFKNPALAACLVSGRFVGTETLDEVLMLLCATRNAKYKRTDKETIEIDGPGCPN